VPVTVQLGLLLSVATAFVSILGFLYKHRGAAEAPPVHPRHPVRSTAALFANRWWTLGIVVATGSWFLHTGALALAPITLVQTTPPVSPRVAARNARPSAVNATPIHWRRVTGMPKSYEAATLALYVGGLALLSVPLMLAASRPQSRRYAGTLLAAAAGLQWGASDVTIKAGTGELSEGALQVAAPLALVILVLSLIGLIVSARSLQVGDAVPVIAVTSAAANLCTIASGTIVFGEPLPEGDAAIAVRLLALALVIVAAALTPGPVDVARRPARPEPA